MLNRLMAVLGLALVTTFGVAQYRYTTLWTPLQRRYLSSYVWSAVAPTQAGPYRLLHVADRTHTWLAIDAEVVPVALPTGESSFALAEATVLAGARHLRWQAETYDHARLHVWLGHWIYHDQTLFDLARVPLVCGLGLLLAGSFAALVSDVARSRAARTWPRPRRSMWTTRPFARRPRTHGAGLLHASPTPRTPFIATRETTDRHTSPSPKVRPRPFFQ